MATVTVTVNGQDARQWSKQEESKRKSWEIAQFLREEMRGMGRASRRHILSSGSGQTTRHRQDGSSVRYYA